MDKIYPTIKISRPKKPNRFYAFFLIGFLVKIIMLIPVVIELLFLGIGEIVVTIINSFVVLFTGKYWDSAYSYNLGLIRFTTKIFFFVEGLTDRYPGFDFETRDFTLNMDCPQNPNRLYAIPIFGGIVRILFMIPYAIYSQVLGNGTFAGVFVSSFPVLFNGNYPESVYEFATDSMRVNQALSSYFMGLSDTYPSFNISMDHKNLKIAMIIVGILLTLSNFQNRANQRMNPYTNQYTAPYTQNYQNIPNYQNYQFPQR